MMLESRRAVERSLSTLYFVATPTSKMVWRPRIVACQLAGPDENRVAEAVGAGQEAADIPQTQLTKSCLCASPVRITSAAVRNSMAKLCSTIFCSAPSASQVCLGICWMHH